MTISNENRNLLNGILGTVAFHLLLLVVFLFLKLGEVKTIHKEIIAIEFSDEILKPIEQQIIEESQPKDVAIDNLSDADMRNIAVNTANKLNEEISTEKYEEEVLKELGIESIKNDVERISDDEIAIEEKPKSKPKKDAVQYTGKTRVEYSLPNRKHRYIHVPVYKCQGYGEVVVSIVVNQEGSVIQSSVLSSTTSEACLSESALEAANLSYFNIDLSAEARQKGTISYKFVAQ